MITRKLTQEAIWFHVGFKAKNNRYYAHKVTKDRNTTLCGVQVEGDLMSASEISAKCSKCNKSKSEHLELGSGDFQGIGCLPNGLRT